MVCNSPYMLNFSLPPGTYWNLTLVIGLYAMEVIGRLLRKINFLQVISQIKKCIRFLGLPSQSSTDWVG